MQYPAPACAPLLSSLRMTQSHLRPFQADKSVTWTDDCSGADVAVIFGGDGTVHRHLATIVEHKLPLLVVPTGSANDFASSLGFIRGALLCGRGRLSAPKLRTLPPSTSGQLRNICWRPKLLLLLRLSRPRFGDQRAREPLAKILARTRRLHSVTGSDLAAFSRATNHSPR